MESLFIHLSDDVLISISKNLPLQLVLWSTVTFIWSNIDVWFKTGGKHTYPKCLIGNQSNTVSVSKNVSIGQLKEKRDHQVDEKKSAQDNVSENTALNKLTEEVQDHIQR